MPNQHRAAFVVITHVMGGAEIALKRYLDHADRALVPFYIGTKSVRSGFGDVKFADTLYVPYRIMRSGLIRLVWNRINFLGSALYLMLTLPVFLRKNRIDTLYFNGSISLVFFSFLPKRAGVVHIGHIHDMVRGVSFRSFLKGASQKLDRVITPSRAAAREIETILGVNEKNISVIPNGISCDSRESIGKRSGDSRVRVGYAGAFVREKGVDILLDAWKNLRGRGYEIDLRISTLYIDESYKKWATRDIPSPLLDGIVFERNSPETMAAFYDSLDIFVLPTLRESFSLVALEAMCHGKIVLVSDLDGPAELVPDRYRFAPGDSSALVRLMEHVLNDLEHEKALCSRQNPEIVRKSYTEAVQTSLTDHLLLAKNDA